MTTYRTGNHWGVTIVREGEAYPAAVLDDCAFCCVGSTGCPLHPAPTAQLVAVVVNGDQVLAERICALLNGDHTPDVDHTRGAAEALAAVADGIADLDGTVLTFRALRQMLERVAAELGVDGDAPSGPAILPSGADEALGVLGPGSDGFKAAGERSGDREESFVARASARHHNAAAAAIAARLLALASVGPGCICNDPPPTVDRAKNGTASRPPGWACPRHGTVI